MNVSVDKFHEGGSRRRRALVGGLWFAASQILPMANTVVLSVVMAKMLGANELGFQSLISYTESTLSGVIVMALMNSSIQSFSALRGEGNDEAAERLVWWSFRAHLLLGLLVGAVLVVMGLVRADDPLSWAVCGLSALANAWAWAYGFRIIAIDGWKAVGRLRLKTQFFAMSFSTVAVLAGGGIVWVFLGNLLGAIWLAMSLRRLVPAATGVRTLRPPHGFGRLWGMILVGEILTIIVLQRSEFFFLDAYSSNSEIAMYSIVFMVVFAVASLPAALGGAAMPMIAAAQAAGEADIVRDNMARSMRVLAILSLGLGAVVFASAPDLILFIYGDEFAPAARLMNVAAAGMVVLPVTGLCNDYWSGRGRLAPVIWAGGVAACVDIAGSVLLIPSHGAFGAVLANLMAQVVAFAVLVTVTWRELGRFRWNVSRLLATVAISVLAAAVGRGLAVLVPGLGGAFLGGMGALVVLVALGAACRVVASDDLDWLRVLVPARLLPARILSHARRPRRTEDR